jgi:transposase-like protein
VIAGLKKIYAAANVLEAEQALENFAQAWDRSNRSQAGEAK